MNAPPAAAQRYSGAHGRFEEEPQITCTRNAEYSGEENAADVGRGAHAGSFNSAGKHASQGATALAATTAPSSSPAKVGAERKRLAAEQRRVARQRIEEYRATLALLKQRGARKPGSPARGVRAARVVAAPLQILAEGDSWFDYPVPFFLAVASSLDLPTGWACPSSILPRKFAALLRDLASVNARVSVSDGQGTLAPQVSSWHNGLHPTKAGFNRFADKFRQSLKAMFPERVF